MGNFSLWSLVNIIRIIATNTVSNDPVGAVNWDPKQWHHQLKYMESNELYSIASDSPTAHDYFNYTLNQIMIPRVSGTEGNRKVREFIESSMRDLGWTVEEDSFMSNTPHGSKPFVNIIATLNPSACRRLMFACHYDSKLFPGRQFVGATDSAVPCAMMIEIARHFSTSLIKHKQEHNDLTLQFVFFDGEEAFEQWTDTDSLYGSRHLAAKWNKLRFPKNQADRQRCPGDFASELDRIDVMVLLDLLGSANPTFYSYFPDTNPLYAKILRAEQQLNDLSLLQPEPPKTTTSYFKNRLSFGGVDDDHKPFAARGVPIVHIIPMPFPSVWHKLSDNHESLSHSAINNLFKIFKVFIASYLHLTI
ncbi:glutaminyl-peptide cyclotransferase-like [Panonychus citri]|uniref:glutaminyl-peptide cyclotransferase-like n=1 Tax=Panonychus citri TaxID=50023 RepID=UPI0023072D97|nr:glutaminyl-peptide cyclotransferase-like [Panonychus citri]